MGGFLFPKVFTNREYGCIVNAMNLAASRRHSVVARADGTVLATGHNGAGECDVEHWRNVVGVAVGNVHTAANTGRSHTVGLCSDGTVLATGWNSYDQCAVSEWRNVAAIAAGWRLTLGLLDDGTVVATGRMQEGACDVQSWRDIVGITCGGCQWEGEGKNGAWVLRLACI